MCELACELAGESAWVLAWALAWACELPWALAWELACELAWRGVPVCASVFATLPVVAVAAAASATDLAVGFGLILVADFSMGMSIGLVASDGHAINTQTGADDGATHIRVIGGGNVL